MNRQHGFTLVEVLVALVVVVLGLAALMVAVSGAARTSGYLRDKTLAQWIALNRISEVRLTVNRTGQTNDTGELQFANRTWHYDTRYYDTSIQSMKRIVVRVWPGDAKTKGSPLAESMGFLGTSLTPPGQSNIDWRQGTAATANPCPNGQPGVAGQTTPPLGGSAAQVPSSGAQATPCVQQPGTGVVTPTSPTSPTSPPTGQTPQ